MKVVTAESIPLSNVQMDGACGTSMRELITDRDGAPTFAMRQFVVEPGGRTPSHSHPWEHEVYVIEGEGHVESASGPRPFRGGDAVFVAPDEQHSFVNSSDAPIRFLCMIPIAHPCCR